jgi:Reverse transcriptase (RNA-dependent DNA polymerase)
LKPGQEGKVLRLKKGLYGLKQAGRGWYLEMLRVFVKELGFTRLAIDHSVFYRCDITSKRAVDAERFKSDIRKFWEITDHGPIKWFLGFEIKRDQDARMLAIN